MADHNKLGCEPFFHRGLSRSWQTSDIGGYTAHRVIATPTKLAWSDLAFFASLARTMPNAPHEGTRVWIYEPREETPGLRSVYREYGWYKGSFVRAGAPRRNVKRTTDHL
jgi:hypothetical protein